MSDFRLVIPAVAAWVSAGLLTGLPGWCGWISFALWAVAALAAATAVVLRRSGDAGADPAVSHPRSGYPTIVAIAAAVCLAAAGAALVGTAVTATAPMRHPDAVARLAHHTVSLRAEVTSPAQPSSGSPMGGERVRFAATVTSATTGITSMPARMPVLVFAPTGTRVEIGETVAISGTTTMLPPASETAALVYAAARPREVAEPPALLKSTNDMRAAFSALAATLPGDGGDLLPGLAIGDVHALSSSLSDDMKRASLTHLTAVSGANCAVVVSLVAAAAGAVGLGRGFRAGAALAALGGFVALVTPQPSVLRAAVMASVVVAGGWAGRPGRAVPVLSLAVIVLLVVDPWLALDYGFVLSVLATGALLLLAPPLGTRLARWMPSRVAAILAVPIAAQVACQPVLFLLNPTVPVYGVLANLVAEPAAPLATVLGLIACLLTPFWPAAAGLLAHLAWVPSAWIAEVARLAAALPASGVEWFTGPLGFVLMLVTTVAFLLLVMRPVRRPARVARILALATSAGLVLCSLAGVAGAGIAEAINRPQAWNIAACDIGQGDAVLLESRGAHALVDVGPDPEPLEACLKTLSIHRIDLLVLTHYDMDHVGGVDAIIGKVGVAMVGPPSDAHGRDVDAELAKGGADVHVAQTGDAGRLGNLDWRVLWPDADPHAMTDGNERSVTMLFDGDGIRSLFLGDLDERAQQALLDTGRVPEVDVVKMAHHGSSDQAEPLYQRVRAAVGLVSCGAGNDYGHPTSTALGILARAGTSVMRTDLEGMLMVAADGHGGLRTWTQRKATRGQLETPARRGAVGGGY